MKKRTIYGLILIAACMGVFLGYRLWDRIRTDTTPPQIHFETEMPEILVSASREELLQSVTATDDRDGDVTASVVVEDIHMSDPADKIATVTVAAFDHSGNVAKAQQEVICKDYRSPRFSLNHTLSFPSNASPNLLRYISAEDVLDGDLTQNIRATALSENGLSTVGIHDVEFRVSNSMGETVKLVLPVEIYDAGTYEAELTLSSYLAYLEPGDTFDARSYLREFSLYGETFSLRNGLSAGFELETSGKVDTDTPGIYTVDYTVTQTRGVSSVRSYSGYSKLFVIVEG